jgi:hypothetical protein
MQEIKTITQNEKKPLRRQLFDATSCGEIVRKIDLHRSEWISRRNGFYSFGAATYLDACGGGSFEKYASTFRTFNSVIQLNFERELEVIRKEIEDVLEATCRYDEGFAMPGFHIFLAPALYKRFSDELHLDLQYSCLPLDSDIFTPTITFTVPIELPLGGGGIEFCYGSPKNPKGELITEIYHPGELMVHTGRTLHRRAHFDFTETCRRITLQGHGIFLENEWILYW